MKKIFLFSGLLSCFFFHAVAWGELADNGVECSVVMKETTFDARASFPDFTLIFTNKGKKTVLLFDDFHPLKGKGPNISIDIWKEKNVGGKNKPIAWYIPPYMIERSSAPLTYITLKPGEKHEVLIKDAYLLLKYFQPFVNEERYVLEVRFEDGYGEPGIRREYAGKEHFRLTDRTPR